MIGYTIQQPAHYVDGHLVLAVRPAVAFTPPGAACCFGGLRRGLKRLVVTVLHSASMPAAFLERAITCLAHRKARLRTLKRHGCARRVESSRVRARENLSCTKQTSRMANLGGRARRASR